MARETLAGLHAEMADLHGEMNELRGKHERELDELREKHGREMAELRDQAANDLANREQMVNIERQENARLRATMAVLRAALDQVENR